MCCHLPFFLLICIDDEGELITTSGSVVGFFFNSPDAAATQCNFKKNVVNSFLFFFWPLKLKRSGQLQRHGATERNSSALGVDLSKLLFISADLKLWQVESIFSFFPSAGAVMESSDESGRNPPQE